MDDTRLRLTQIAGDSSRISDILNSASKENLFAKIAAINACTANPYQPAVTWQPSPFGGFIQLDLREAVAQSIFLTGAFEPDLLWLFTRIVDRGATAFDCGAHIGFFSLALGQLVGPTGHVESFEPVATTKAHLDVNIQNAGLSHVKAHQVAVWSETKPITIYDYGPSLSAYNGVGMPRVPDTVALPAGQPSTVQAVSIDEFVASSGRIPSVIKVDVENAEYEVMRGAEAVLRAHAPILVLEVGDLNKNEDLTTSSTGNTLIFVESLGYQIFDIKNETLIPYKVDPERRYDYGNIVAVPESRVEEILRRVESEAP